MQKQRFRCTGCNWKFTRQQRPSLCPYCGKMAVVEDVERAADEILSEINAAEEAFNRRK